jgi:hypothetical protein
MSYCLVSFIPLIQLLFDLHRVAEITSVSSLGLLSRPTLKDKSMFVFLDLVTFVL